MKFTSGVLGAPVGAPVPFRDALFAGLAPDGTLYRPVAMPDLSRLFASFGPKTSFRDVAAATLAALLTPELSAAEARDLAERAFPFAPVLRPLDGRILLLELFHGPTCAFKDFGARFLAASMERFLRKEKRRITILVATSGDTGSAVAHAFHGMDNIQVVILYPSGRVSLLQEKQLTTLGGNVHALEVEGSFDDCQRMAKEAFRDVDLRARLTLTSANSINIGRLLPQSLYYIWASAASGAASGAAGGGPQEAVSFCVPSGNFGNLTAGVYAWSWGLPVRAFLAATNTNDVVPAYLKDGMFRPRPSVATLSNAMDVGNPSNFERLLALFDGDCGKMGALLRGDSVSDGETMEEMRATFEATGIVVDPHTAVGIRAARRLPAGTPGGPLIVLSTAHPAKFMETVERAIGQTPELPEALRRAMELPKRSVRIAPRMAELSEYLKKLS